MARLATDQNGVVSRRQLSEIGVGRGAIDRWLDRRRLHPIHAGVYAVGHGALTPEGRWTAAVLAGGPGAVLSHRSAAALWRVLPDPGALIEITAPSQRRTPGLCVHRRRLPLDEITSRGGIATTSVPRTLFDLAAVVPRARVERAVNEAEVRRLTDPLSLDVLVQRNRGRRGVAVIRLILDQRRIGAGVTRSRLEERFLAFVDDAGLPRPQTNAGVQLGGRWVECDCVWRAQRVVVELDGHAFHATRDAYERDRIRDRELSAAGWQVVRVTWHQLERAPEALAADLWTLLDDSNIGLGVRSEVG